MKMIKKKNSLERNGDNAFKKEKRKKKHCKKGAEKLTVK